MKTKGFSFTFLFLLTISNSFAQSEIPLTQAIKDFLDDSYLYQTQSYETKTYPRLSTEDDNTASAVSVFLSHPDSTWHLKQISKSLQSSISVLPLETKIFIQSVNWIELTQFSSMQFQQVKDTQTNKLLLKWSIPFSFLISLSQFNEYEISDQLIDSYDFFLSHQLSSNSKSTLPSTTHLKPSLNSTPKNSTPQSPTLNQSSPRIQSGLNCINYPRVSDEELLYKFNSGESKYLPGQLLIRTKNIEPLSQKFQHLTKNALYQSHQSKVSAAISDSSCGLVSQPIFKNKNSLTHESTNTYILKLPGDADIEKVALMLTNETMEAEPDYLYHYAETENYPLPYPGEPFWNHSSTGMNAYQAWKDFGPVCLTGDYLCAPGLDVPLLSEPVVIAMFDSGTTIGHPSLKPNLWVNSSEIPDNNQDDDGDGYIDNYNGYSTVTNDGNLTDGFPSNYGTFYHGTQVSGIMTATPAGPFSVTGVSWGTPSKLMTIKISSSNTISSSNIIEGIQYVLDMKNKGVNIRVANFSIYEENGSNAEKSAFESLRNAGILAVVAAANFGSNKIPYPAQYPLENIITVGNMSKQGDFMPSSNYHRCLVDLIAPGQSVSTTNYHLDRGFTVVSPPDGGTSLATPHVSAMAAWLFSHFPNASWKKVKWAILRAAELTAHQESNPDKQSLTNGKANLYEAYLQLLQHQNTSDDELDRIGPESCNNGNVGESGGGSAIEPLFLILLGISFAFLRQRK